MSGYSGDAGDGLQYEGDYHGDGYFGSYYHNGMNFSTYDQDNAWWCAWGRGGGWWFNGCYWVCLTCQMSNFEWAFGDARTSRMMIKPQ